MKKFRDSSVKKYLKDSHKNSVDRDSFAEIIQIIPRKKKPKMNVDKFVNINYA